MLKSIQLYLSVFFLVDIICIWNTREFPRASAKTGKAGEVSGRETQLSIPPRWSLVRTLITSDSNRKEKTDVQNSNWFFHFKIPLAQASSKFRVSIKIDIALNHRIIYRKKQKYYLF